MDWLRAHLYGVLLATVLIALAGVYFVSTRLPLSATGSVSNSTWGGTGGVNLFPDSPNATKPEQRPSTEELLRRQARNDIPIFSPTGIALDTAVSPKVFDFDALLAELSGSIGTKTSPTSEGPDFSSLYSFIPQGFISTTATVPTRTDAQQALFEYGNTVGSYLRGFEDSHMNMPTTLKNARADPGNSMKVEAAAQIGRDYKRLGEDLKAIANVPTSARSKHMAFAEAHILVGENLIRVVQTTSPDEFLTIIDTYNKSVETYTKEYIALATLFQSENVAFNAYDAGSVFTFNSSLSL